MRSFRSIRSKSVDGVCKTKASPRENCTISLILAQSLQCLDYTNSVYLLCACDTFESVLGKDADEQFRAAAGAVSPSPGISEGRSVTSPSHGMISCEEAALRIQRQVLPLRKLNPNLPRRRSFASPLAHGTPAAAVITAK